MLISVVLFCASIVSSHAEPLTLSNKQGQSLEAELLAIEGEQVLVRRVSDGAEFSLQIQTLDIGSQQQIASWQSSQAGTAPH